MLSAVVWARQGAEGRRPGALDEEGSSSRKDDEEHAEDDDEDELPPGVGVSEREHNTDAHVLETEDDEEEDVRIHDPDLVLLGLKADQNDEHLLLQFVYEPEDDRGPPNIFPHHEVPLAAFPLCAEWLPGAHGTVGTHAAAIGSANSSIEIFDMDILDTVEPSCFLEPAHDGGTMALAWNSRKAHVLASGGADFCCKLWDIEQGSLQQTLSQHSGKVQALDWSRAEPSVLLSASFDQSARVVDARAPSSLSMCIANLPADAEDAIWDSANPSEAFVSSEDGSVLKLDARASGKGPLWSLTAHESTACTALCTPPAAPGMLLTASYDGSMKVWDCRGGSVPELVLEPAVRIGALFALSVAGEEGSAGCMVAAAGANGEPAIIDLKAFDEVTKRWSLVNESG